MTLVPESPPYTHVDVVTQIFHGVEVIDPYRWLEDQNSKRTRRWIVEQTGYARAVLDSLPVRKPVRSRVVELLAVKMIGPPFRIRNRYFFLKRQERQNHPIICMREGRNGKDRILVDPSVRWPDGQMSVHIVTVSPDARLLAYGVRHGSEDYQTVEILDIASLEVFPDGLPRGFLGGFVFSVDTKSYYYVHEAISGPRAHYCAAFQHIIGTDPIEDREMFSAGEYPHIRLAMQFSDDRHYVAYSVIRSHRTKTIDLYVQDLSQGLPARLIADGMTAPFYPLFIRKELIVVTSFQAPNRKIIGINLDSTDRMNWRDVVPESTLPIKGFTIRNNLIFVSYVENLSIRTDIFDLSGRKRGSLPVPDRGSVSLIPNPVDTDELFYTFSSFVYPETVFSYQIETGEQKVWSRKNVPFDPTSIEITQTWYRSKDGTAVPISLIGKKGLRKNRNTPTILTGYGGFGKSVTPQFSAFATFIVEQGCLFAVANVRGGLELGAIWHLEAKREKRQNAFNDFIAAAEWLIENGFTLPEKLAIAGGSNGGLLVGAALTQRPELFRVAVCIGPLLDMLSYHQFSIAKSWIEEYGTADDPEDFRHLYAYSPYHRVQEGTSYPAVLLVSGDSDTRCSPMHALKMTAKLQAATSSERPILLEYRALRGHIPSLPLDERTESLTDRLAFICDQLCVPVYVSCLDHV